MMQFSLRSVFVLVSAMCFLLAGTLHFPLFTAVVVIFSGAIITRLYARRKISGPLGLWFYAALGAAVSMLICVFVGSIQLQLQGRPDGVQVSWSRAFPVSLFFGMLVGTVVSIVDHLRTMPNLPHTDKP